MKFSSARFLRLFFTTILVVVVGFSANCTWADVVIDGAVWSDQQVSDFIAANPVQAANYLAANPAMVEAVATSYSAANGVSLSQDYVA